MGETPAPGRTGAPAIRSEARGPHWVAWIADENGKPKGSVVVVGATREEAEDRVRQWGGQILNG